MTSTSPLTGTRVPRTRVPGTRSRARLALGFVVVGVLTLGLAACTAAGTPAVAPSSPVADVVTPSPTSSPAEAISVLYTLSADTGALTPVEGSATDFTLVLFAADRHTVWFSDRPARLSGTLDTADLVDDWAGFGFVADPPTVAVVLHEAGGSADTLVAEVSEPAYDASTGDFSATVRVLDELTGQGADAFEHFSSTADAGLPPSFAGVSIFVNDEVGEVVDGCIVATHPTC